MPRLSCLCVLSLLATIPLGVESAGPKPTPSATESEAARDAASPRPSRPALPPLPPLPPLKVVGKKTATLGFALANVGPSGAGGVDVYVTTDEGVTWRKSANDPAVSLPEGAGEKPPRGTVKVALPREGVVYGFRLVVKSRAGLAKSGPVPGDAPQVRVECDTTRPLAELYMPLPGDRPNSLLLTWKAQDRNLAENPVSLDWSRDGSKWHPIGNAELPNTGRFAWHLPAGIPAKVLLKLTVRDRAGNVAVARTSEPVLIDSKRPEVVDVTVVD
jgi:hypothetical protein